MITRIIFVVSLLLSASSASAQQQEGLHASYVSIQMRTDTLDSAPTTSAVCGGIVADEKRRLIATAWHCVPNQRSVIEKPGIFSVGGMSAKLIHFSPEADLALFQVENLKGLKAPTFKTPKKGDVVVASAYYDEFPVVGAMTDRTMPVLNIKAVLDWEGKVAAVANGTKRTGERYDKIEQTPFKWIVVSGSVAGGFSGGPVFDKTGNFIGIFSSVNGGFTSLSSSENVTTMIKSLK